MRFETADVMKYIINTLLQKSFENTNCHAKEKYAELPSLCIFHFQAKTFFLIAKMHISINVCQTHANLWDCTAVISVEFWHLNNGYCQLPDNVKLFSNWWAYINDWGTFRYEYIAIRCNRHG